MNITASTARYEAWLATELGDELVAADLDAKHQRMAEAPFPFLRATYWRWAECILNWCPALAEAESVLAVGDIHLENFGTWRDADGRQIWGVNDYDEAAEMPWPLDLVRLATSALLATPKGPGAADISAALLAGYAAGLENPRPFVLDQQPGAISDAVRHAKARPGQVFWDRLEKAARAHAGKPGPRWLAALHAALPHGAEVVRVARRTAGTGSLGRPRWVMLAEWRGGRVAREAKAVVASAWVLPPGRGGRAPRCQEAASGAYRVPDPWYAVANHIVVRRLSPNNRKIELAEDTATLLSAPVLQAMGHELASMHRGSSGAGRLRRGLAAMPKHWLKQAATLAAERTAAEHAEWRAGFSPAKR